MEERCKFVILNKLAQNVIFMMAMVVRKFKIF